ncbi:MAG TPA: calcium-binding protein, partial [Planktothrix sp. UBA10369]|nr:calcium-binding protein [Planktothrix sp. UBA10369]
MTSSTINTIPATLALRITPGNDLYNTGNSILIFSSEIEGRFETFPADVQSFVPLSNGIGTTLPGATGGVIFVPSEPIVEAISIETNTPIYLAETETGQFQSLSGETTGTIQTGPAGSLIFTPDGFSPETPVPTATPSPT